MGPLRQRSPWSAPSAWANRFRSARANCTFSAFEEDGLPGAFLEFFEAPDSQTLTAAHAAAPEPIVDPRRIYKLVEL